MSSPVASPAEIENLGVLFAGFIASAFLYGFTFFQSYVYFFRFPKDHRWTRVLAFSLAILDFASTALVTHVGYYYLVEMFGAEIEDIHAIPTLCAQDLISGIITLVTHLFFASRIYTVCGGPTSITSRLVALVVCLLGFLSFALGVISVRQLFQHRELSAMASPSMGVIAGISQGSAVVAYIIIFIALFWALRPARYPDMLVPQGVVGHIVAVCITRGLVLIIFQLGCLIAFIISPTKPYWIAFQIATCRVCVNTILGLLNAREVKLGVGFNVEETVSESNDSHGGLPSLQFRSPPTNTKTQQTLNFTQLGTESGRSEAEDSTSKQLGDEEHLDSIHSHYSEHPEDKARLSLSSECARSP